MNGFGWIFGPMVGSVYFYSRDAAGRSTGSETLYIPYVASAIGVLVLAGIFALVKMPDIATADEYHMDNGTPGVSHSIWSHPHFSMAVLAQFLYVAAQAGIFSFFINYMVEEPPDMPASWHQAMQTLASNAGILSDWLSGWLRPAPDGVSYRLTEKGAANLAALGFVFFLAGRFSGAAILRRFAAHRVLGFYGTMNVLATLIVFFKFGWVSVACVFVSYFFMSIMFPTIFALGIHGLGARAKKASSFIVMAIMGGALLPKLMGYVADVSNMSRGFIVPMFCFVFVAWYGFQWPRLSKAESLTAAPSMKGH